MRQSLLFPAITILLPLGIPAYAQNAPGTAAPDQPTAAQPEAGAGASTGTAGSEAQGNVRPNPEGATGTTQGGGITPTAREIIPTTPPEGGTTAAPGETDAAAAGAQAGGAGPTKEVTPEILKEIREMAIEAEKKAAKPAPTKSAEAIAAEKKAIEAHRDGIFARIAERLS